MDDDDIYNDGNDIGLSGHILDLMIKNVSKNDPLNPTEIKELKEVRSKLTKDQWNVWLQHARNEKSRRLNDALNKNFIEEQNLNENNFYNKHTSRETTPDTNKKKVNILANDEALAAIIQNQKQDVNSNFNDDIDKKLHIRDMKYSPNSRDENNFANEYSNTDNTHSPRSSHYNENPKTTDTMSPFLLNQKSQINNRYINVNNDKLEEITDIATASALRIDSVQSAAKCLIASIEADMKEKVSASPGQMEDKSTTLSILQSMVTSLEKSSSSLDQIVKLKTINTNTTIRSSIYDHDDILNDTIDEGSRTQRSYSVGMEQSRGLRNYNVFEREPRSRGRSPSPAPLRRNTSRDNLSYS